MNYIFFICRSCDQEKGICSFPSAHVQLTKKQQLLMVGQPYKVNLQLEMPESPANKQLGKSLLILFIIIFRIQFVFTKQSFLGQN